MCRVKVKMKGNRVQITLGVTAARYLYSALNKVGPNPKDLFPGGEYSDPVYDALGKFLEGQGINDSVALAKPIEQIVQESLR